MLCKYVLGFILCGFVSSVQAETIAHWNFEQDLVDASVVSGGGYGHTTANGVFQSAAADISGNGNHLSAWGAGSYGVNHGDDVPAYNQVGSTRSVTNASASAAGLMTLGGLELSGEDVGALQDWTIEAAVKFSNGSMGRYVTILGMDGEYGYLAPVYFQKTNANKVRILITDAVGATEIISSQSVVVDTWYHVVAVNNASDDTMKLFLNGQLVGSATAKTIPAYTSGTSGSDAWAISVGRGLYKNLHADRLSGYIDDIRISNVALPESQFLQNFDSDSDGINDFWELGFAGISSLDDLNGGNAGSGPGSGTGDFDGDGVSDLTEFQLGSRPNDKDSDGDGLEDGDEVSGRLNPFLLGVLRQPFTPGSDAPGDATSPVSDDSDDDGCRDKAEIAYGTDPNSSTSTPPDLQDVLVFSFFRSNGQNGVYLAYSRDGLNWTELNDGNVVLVPDEGTLTRDPHITRGKDGKFHMVWTTNWSGTDMGYAFSDDLINWSEPQRLDVMGSVPNAENVWAPEMVYDESNDHYTIFWSSRVTGTFNGEGRQYQTTTKDFVTFTQAELFYEPGWDVIDASIIEVGDGTYGMFVKDERDPGKSLHYTTSINESGPYAIPASAPLFGGAAGGGWAEGPSAAKLGDTWFLYWDYYRLGYYGVATSSDLVNWTEKTNQLTMPSGVRHGTMFAMPASEFDAIFFPPIPVGEPAVMRHRYNFDGDVNDSIGAEDGTLVNITGGSSFSGGQLELGNDGSQTGANVDHVALPANLISNLGDDISIELWAGVTSDAAWQRFFDFGEGSDGSGSNGYYIFASPHTNTDILIAGYKQGTTNIEQRLGESAAITSSLTEPTHLVLTWDGENDAVILYVNGVEVDKDLSPHFDITDMADVTNYLGRSRWTSDSGFVGSFDELRLWKGVLTAEEVATHYTNGSNATPAPRDHDDDGLSDVDEYKIINFSPSDDIEGLDDVAGPDDSPSETDFDKDGQSDAEEIAIGTDPTDANSRFKIDSFQIDRENQDIVIRWKTAGFVPGTEFVVYRSNDMVNWVPISAPIPIQGSMTSFTDEDYSEQVQSVFYSVEAAAN
ncbi:family 43 glycosylhydrolase [Verrucomicrobiaceae bacterium N1E253]|uniref:Family 43 glycosylhydrolase n=1 Tax=Oceaniferula marina TaxID=2748318 RepID=A0A851GNA8_9BACT|nr:LamG-like jellyroll fold domain-containing protein [Oceaniferula marina]NWK55614.1 family 43 glycosylhydrolase [Oceaniferula marina]